MSKKTIKNEIKLRTYSIISNAIENAIHRGYKRSFKHTDNPTEDIFIESIHRAIMEDLDEIIDFDWNEK